MPFFLLGFICVLGFFMVKLWCLSGEVMRKTVCLIGRPNTGKSTLINTLINQKIAIVSDVAGTTRNTIQGIYHDEDTQIVFVDTPGIAKASARLGKHLNKQSYESLEE